MMAISMCLIFIRTNRKKILPSTASFRWYFDRLYSNSMCKQSSMPTSILIELFVSGSSGHAGTAGVAMRRSESVWASRASSTVPGVATTERTDVDADCLLVDNAAAVLARDGDAHKVPAWPESRRELSCCCSSHRPLHRCCVRAACALRARAQGPAKPHAPEPHVDAIVRLVLLLDACKFERIRLRALQLARHLKLTHERCELVRVAAILQQLWRMRRDAVQRRSADQRTADVACKTGPCRKTFLGQAERAHR